MIHQSHELNMHISRNSVSFMQFHTRHNLWSRSCRYWSCCLCYQTIVDWAVGRPLVHTAALHGAGCDCEVPVSTTDTRCRAPSRAELAPTHSAVCTWNQEDACETTAQMRHHHRRHSLSGRRQMSTGAQTAEQHQYNRHIYTTILLFIMLKQQNPEHKGTHIQYTERKQ